MKKFVAKVIEKYYLTENEKFLVVKLELLEQNNTINFLAGQYVSLKINDKGERRSYSIISTPDIDHGVSLLVEIVPGGKGSDFLKNIQIGREVEMLAPMGRFTVSPSDAEAMEGKQDNLLFVATGSGIAPIISMINDELINKQNKNQIRLHWGMRSEEDLFWLDNLGRLAEEHPNFVFDVVLSQSSSEWELCRGHVQDCLMRDMSEVVKDGWDAYICGNQKMVEDVVGVLKRMGMQEDKIHYERFV